MPFMTYVQVVER